MERVLDKNNLQKFLDDLNRKFKVLGPTSKGGATSTYSYPSFNPAEKAEKLNLDYNVMMVSPKNILFPDSESLFKYRKENGGIEIQDQRERWDEERVLIGVHPCDITAISLLDKIFTEEEFEEPFYKERRKNLIIIGTTCSKPGTNCFCNVTGSGPDIENNYDLLMTDVDDHHFFKTGSPIGEELINKEYFRKPTEQERKLRGQAIEKVREELPQEIDITDISEKMEGKFNEEIWDEFSNMCVTCGNCNMVCPTCHCFTIKEKTNEDRTEGERVRTWDSCHFKRFAEMASGLNVREGESSRFKHRLYDKFFYDPLRYDTMFCVGCGRCIEFCQSRIDIRDALKGIQEE